MILVIILFFVVITIFRKSKHFLNIVWPFSIGLIILAPTFLGVISKGISIKYALLGVFMGHMSYLIGCIIVKRKEDNIVFFPMKVLLYDKQKKKLFEEFVNALFNCTYEELLWRGTVQVTFGKNLISILLVVILFSTSHINPKVKSKQIVDITFFSTLLGIVFYITANIWLVTIIHITRNMCISFVNRLNYIIISEQSSKNLEVK